MKTIEGDYAERLKQYQEQRLPHCRLCMNWFLGCLNGRSTWKDKAVRPGFRLTGQSGREYQEPDSIPGAELPLRSHCDEFEWGPDPERLGRVVAL